MTSIAEASLIEMTKAPQDESYAGLDYGGHFAIVFEPIWSSSEPSSKRTRGSPVALSQGAPNPSPSSRYQSSSGAARRHLLPEVLAARDGLFSGPCSWTIKEAPYAGNLPLFFFSSSWKLGLVKGSGRGARDQEDGLSAC